MKIFLILLSIISVAQISSCIKIDCEFKNDFIHNWGLRYTCRTRKFTIKGDERKIKDVAGDHLKNCTTENVTQYFARSLNIERFPSGLGEKFSGLEVVRITLCNMRLLLKNDTENLPNLKYLDLIGNKIEKLGSDTFENVPKLLEVVLNNNRLQFIGSKLLEPLQSLQMISFGGNLCIASHSKYSDEQLARLKREIELKCSDISMTDVILRFDGVDDKLESLLGKIYELSKSLSKRDKNLIEKK